MTKKPVFVRLDLDKIKRELYDELTTPELRPLLTGKDLEGIFDSSIIAVEARIEDFPVALALATYRQHLHFAEINSIFVRPEFRRQKIATRLLEALQNEVKKESGSALEIVYSLSDEFAPAWNKILEANHWPQPKPFMIQCRFLGAAFNPPWIHHKVRFPEGYHEFFWSEITETDKKQINRMVVHGVVPRVLSPFFEEERIEPINSLGLRDKEEIVGWMITHRIDPETIRYTSLFMLRSLRSQVYSIKLLIDAIHLQKKSGVKWAMFELPLIQVHPAWTQFVEKRLIPYADEITHLVQAWRQV